MEKNGYGPVLRATPVLIACEGCPQHGQAARDVASLLQARGLVEAEWLGSAARRATARGKAASRFPVYALDACDQGCARRWLAAETGRARGAFTLSGEERLRPAQAADRLAGEL